MKTILVSKTGMSLVTRELASKGSANGEQGETEGLMRHLKSRGDVRVIYFGPFRGDYTDVCDHVILPEKPPGTDELIDPRDQEIAWATDIDRLKQFEPIALINVAGPPATFSWVDNPKGSIVQAQGIYYTGPILNACHKLGIPRVVVNNDPRTYPRDQEMSFGWSKCRPAALLDQWEGEREMVVGGQRYRRVSKYAACQSWSWLPQAEDHYAGREACKIIAHCHVTDGCKQKGRRNSWEMILGPEERKFPIFGSGWDAMGIDTVKVPPNVALEHFHTALCTPCVSPAPGFYSGKAWVALSQGCIPIPYGDGQDPYTWDPYEKYVPFSGERCFVPGDLASIAAWLENSSEKYYELLGVLRGRFAKDFSVLDQLVDELLAGTFKFGAYGGYLPC